MMALVQVPVCRSRSTYGVDGMRVARNGAAEKFECAEIHRLEAAGAATWFCSMLLKVHSVRD
jgi:hypothetical protein